LSEREDGLIDIIKPLSVARRSTQEEIELAIGCEKKGPRIFLATIQYSENQKLIDENGKFITVTLPVDMYYHQILICGKTGSGKTVAAKYFAQYFVEELEGAVLAVNVKGDDLLKMYLASKSNSEEIKKEWDDLGLSSHGVRNFVVYYPPFTSIPKGVDENYCEKITMNTNEIDPNALTGLLQNISDVAAFSLPNIFRFWKEKKKREDETFSDFVLYFQRGKDDEYTYSTLNERDEEGETKLHYATYQNLVRNLDNAKLFFDNKGAKTLQANDILVKGKMAIINVADYRGIEFGAILLRDILHKIVLQKDEKRNTTPILIIIDEVHQFYNTESSREALGDLDTICRTGRSKQIGIIFSSQNPEDIPRGLEGVINTKIVFNSSERTVKSIGVDLSSVEIESLKKGYAVGTVYGMPHLKVFKVPLALAGVLDQQEGG